jgi:hypothetical protein
MPKRWLLALSGGVAHCLMRDAWSLPSHTLAELDGALVCLLLCLAARMARVGDVPCHVYPNNSSQRKLGTLGQPVHGVCVPGLPCDDVALHALRYACAADAPAAGCAGLHHNILGQCIAVHPLLTERGRDVVHTSGAAIMCSVGALSYVVFLAYVAWHLVCCRCMLVKTHSL